MKRSIAFYMAALVGVSVFAGCGSAPKVEEPVSEAASEATQMANPVHECSKEDLAKETGFVLDVPEDAENITYCYIDTDDEKMAEVDYTMDEQNFCYRVKSTMVVDIMDNVDGTKSDESTLLDAMKECTNVGAAQSGVYNEWTEAGKTMVKNRDAVYALDKDGMGIIAWIDIVPGVSYSLSVDQGITLASLKDTAEMLFVPTQE